MSFIAELVSGGENAHASLCGNKDSLEYLEEKRWNDGCKVWEAKIERKGEIKCVNG